MQAHKFNLRMSEEFREKVKIASDKENRSMASLMIFATNKYINEMEENKNIKHYVQYPNEDNQ